ncbi:putative acetyltransferase [compost metagenome]
MRQTACSWVESNVVAESSIIGENSTWIRRGTRIVQSIIEEGVFVGFRCRVEHTRLHHSLMLGARCMLLGTKESPITVGPFCWLGGGVIVEKGVHIGEGAIIGAGSHVISDIPAYTIAVGQPAKVLKVREIERDEAPGFSDFLAHIRNQPISAPNAVGAQIGQRAFITACLSAGTDFRMGEDGILIGQKNENNEGGIVAGQHVSLGKQVILEALGGIRIGDATRIGDDVLIMTTTHDYGLLSLPQLRRPVSIGSNVEIGHGSIVIGGVTIGNGATILPGSLVIRDVKTNETVSGVPARPCLHDGMNSWN